MYLEETVVYGLAVTPSSVTGLIQSVTVLHFVIVTTGISYNMNWRIQYMIPSVLSIIASIIIAKKYPESPRWLEAQGRVEEADAIMTQIEKEIEASTGKPLPPVTEEAKSSKTTSVLGICLKANF